MEPHLNHLLPWSSLVSLSVYDDNKTRPIIFTVGECGKIHLETKKDKIRFRNRKYITDEMICNEEECKPETKTKFTRPNQKKKWKFNLSHSNLFQVKSYRDSEAKIICKFFHEFHVNLEKFADGLLQRLMKRKRNNHKERMFILPEEYDTEYDLEPFENYNYDHMYQEMYDKEIVIKRLVEYYGTGPDTSYVANDWLYAFISTENDDDLLYIFNHILRNPDFIFHVVQKMGSQCFGTYSRYILQNMLDLYLYLNVIIASGNFDNPDCWGYLNKSHWTLSSIIDIGDFHEMVPCWAQELFDIKKFLDKKYDYHENIEPFKFRNYIKKENVNSILKKLFRFQYTWVAIYKFSIINYREQLKKNKKKLNPDMYICGFNTWYEIEDLFPESEKIGDDEWEDLYGEEEKKYFNPLAYWDHHVS